MLDKKIIYGLFSKNPQSLIDQELGDESNNDRVDKEMMDRLIEVAHSKTPKLRRSSRLVLPDDRKKDVTQIVDFTNN